MATPTQKITAEDLENIRKSRDQFDLSAELTPVERQMLGEIVRESTDERVLDEPVRIKDIEEDDFTAIDVVDLVMNNREYNERYAYYVRCQTLATLVAFEDGWNNFQDMVLKAYVRMRRMENKEYRGDDRDKAHALRLKQQAAEDFVSFINSSMQEARNYPKPNVG